MKIKTQAASAYLRLSLSALTACVAFYGCGAGGDGKQGGPLGSLDAEAEALDDFGPKKKKPYEKPVDDAAHEPTLDVSTPAAEPTSEAPAEEAIPEVARLTSSVGVKSFSQINATMSALTTIPSTNPVVAPVYAQLATQLPDGNDIRAFLPSHQVAISKLAVEYCDVMVDTPAAAGVVLPGIALNVAPATALNATGREAINKALVSRFWGTGLADVPDLGETLAALSTLTDELLAGKNMNSAALTPSVVKGLCTAVLASGPVTFQ
jgi:hypothetical protein